MPMPMPPPLYLGELESAVRVAGASIQACQSSEAHLSGSQPLQPLAAAAAAVSSSTGTSGSGSRGGALADA